MNLMIETWSVYSWEMWPGFTNGDNHDQRDAGAVAEVVERLHVARVVVAAAFVEGDEDRGVLGVGRKPQPGRRSSW